MTPPPRSRPARALLALPVGVLLATVIGLLGPVPTAQASTTYLCSGYDSCQSRGYSHAGYKRAGGRMYWRMYSGHNCTNYAAYRMVKNGMPNVRPWSGGGNAMYWGTEKRRITNDTPRVGAVAWWKANVPGAGSVGHVAYVERVLSRRKIVVSEDSWGGDFGWKTITRAGSGWPSGFIHFNDRKVRATTAPTVVGAPAVGEAVRVRVGRWRPSARVSVQWYAGGEAVAGATESSFTPRVAHRGKRLTVKVTAHARGYLPGVARTEPTARVTRGRMRTTVVPMLTGTPRVDEVLELQRGSVQPTPGSRSVRWFADGERIAGADTNRLRLRQGQIGDRITAVVLSDREGYRRHRATTAPTDAVAAGRFEVSSPFVLDGVPRHGRRLVVRPGEYRPRDAEVRYTWLRDGEEVPRIHTPAYDLTNQDVGHRLAVRVELSRAGYRDRTMTLRTTGLVTTTPEVQVRTEGRPRRALVRLRVTAPGVAQPGGEATVRIDRTSETARVVDGRLQVVLRGLDPGRHDVVVRYAGTEVIRPARATATVRVPRS